MFLFLFEYRYQFDIRWKKRISSEIVCTILFPIQNKYKKCLISTKKQDQNNSIFNKIKKENLIRQFSLQVQLNEYRVDFGFFFSFFFSLFVGKLYSIYLSQIRSIKNERQKIRKNKYKKKVLFVGKKLKCKKNVSVW